MKQRNIVIALLLGALFVIAGVAAVGPNTALFKAIIVTNDAAIGGDLTTTGDQTVGGDMVITGGLEVTGGVTGTNVLTTGNQTIAGIKTFSTPAIIPAITGPTAAATGVPGAYVNNLGAANVSFEVRDAATPVFQVRNGGAVAAGAIYSTVPILTKDANYLVTAADTGAIIKNTAIVSATFTLPGAVAGYNYCIYNYAGTDVIIEFTDATDVALNEVNSPGDSVTNTTAYDSICLTAIDATNWGTISSVGTWADGN